ncbi:glycosyltransferase family 2 protein [Rubellimicrobium rubrum]|uniref:glycosyltransferase family 2 protein n=1 Tax=Rubellimicrobium rubrum TaxID=2585369 RepID=UPI00159BB9C0|nr:glycosyltransferase [Rubellimicrobium rubrum]
MTRISFIMPTYNRASLIEESLRSICAQMTDDDEVLVVDDGSTDGTGEVVNALDLPVRYVAQENKGKSAALNRGLAMTDGQYIWICDDDDLLCIGAVRTLIQQAETTRADVVFGKYTRFRLQDGEKVDLGTGYWPDLSSGSLARHILEDAFAMHNATLTRRSAYERIGGFNEEYLRSQDYEMYVRMAIQATLSYVDSVIFEQRKHDSARGPGTIRHSAGSSEDVWKQFDTKIFENLWSAVPLDFYEGMVEGARDDLVLRAARLQRAAIMARHGLWHHALEDIEAAARISPDVPLQALEQDICRRAVSGKHGFAGILDGQIVGRLDLLNRGSNKIGKSIVINLALGMLWRYRQSDRQPKADASQFMRSVLGVSDYAGILGRKLAISSRLVNSSDDATALTEVADLSPWGQVRSLPSNREANLAQ